MKKTLIIALAGMMLFAFTQCGGGTTKGSKEFTEAKALYEKLEKAAKDAKTCDELQEAALGMLFSGLANGKYTDEEKITEKEKEELEKYLEKISKAIEEKSKKLGCEDE